MRKICANNWRHAVPAARVCSQIAVSRVPRSPVVHWCAWLRYEVTALNTQHEAIAREFLLRLDAGGDLASLVTDDIDIWYPKWGRGRGKADFVRFYKETGQYISSMSHDHASLRILCVADTVVVEGRSSGKLTNGMTWQPVDDCLGAFCTIFRIRGDLISRFAVYLDPDYCDQTTSLYPWRTPGK